jgi:hypothetical protein
MTAGKSLGQGEVVKFSAINVSVPTSPLTKQQHSDKEKEKKRPSQKKKASIGVCIRFEGANVKSPFF